jgi:hypothetical protein
MIPTIGRWPDAPDLIEPIVGYRAWRYTMSDRAVQLFALGHTRGDDSAKNEWAGAWSLWVTASCGWVVEPTHVVPDEDCTCGFYAMKSADDVAGFSIESDPADSLEGEGATGIVLGRVFLAGKVIEHAFGYRAERARIVELIPTTVDRGITRTLASRLELPVGPTLDMSSLMRAIEEARSSQTVPPPRPGLVDRLRLRTHQRQFHLIRGAGRDDDSGVLAPGPTDPLGGFSPPAA